MSKTPLPNSPTHPRMIQSVLRERRALELRLANRTFDEIAGELGYTDKSAARKAVMRALEHNAGDPTKEALDLHIAQLDDLYRSLYPNRDDPKVAAVMVRILSERAKSLGLTKPPAEPALSLEEEQRRNPALPLTAEQSLRAAEKLQRIVGEVAAKHADSIIAKREAERAAAERPKISGKHKSEERNTSPRSPSSLGSTDAMNV